MCDARSAPVGSAGFSLVELLVALVVGLFVTGAVYGLILGGSNAFTREPERADRQQNVRIAMDSIQRDISSAGTGAAPWVQAFTVGDGPAQGAPLLNGRGPAGPLVATRGNSDVLEMLSAVPECTEVRANAGQPSWTAVGNIAVDRNLPSCFTLPAIVLGTSSTNPARAALRVACGPGPGVPAGILFAPGGAPGTNWATWSFFGGNVADRTNVWAGQLVRYWIANDPLDGVPSLFRSTVGAAGNTIDGACGRPPIVRDQIVARGIEDMQIVYVRADGNRFDSAPAVDWITPNFNTLTTQVEVTLVARVMTANHQGSTVAPNDPRAFVRGTMTSTTAVRAALLTLRDNAAGGQVWK
jgi:prepilin-type N-terminal cleavage/methylation domain-containing protein